MRKFGYQKPDELTGEKQQEAFDWLSRGVEKAILDFISGAKDSSYALRASVYEFSYDPVIEALKNASQRGADVKIIYDSRKDYPRETTDEKIESHSIRNLMIRRTQQKSYICHHKFIILLKDDEPIAVLTGSTNFTKGGIFGQSNVVHIVQDKDVAAKYYEYWINLEPDTPAKEMRKINETLEPDPPDDLPENSITTIFSPRKSLNMMEWYARQIDNATDCINLTAAFGVNKSFAEVLGEDKDYLRFLLLERKGDTYDIYSSDSDVLIALGSHLKSDILEKWTKEALTEYNHHVRYIHTKYLLIDPLSNDPLVVTGSANFSDASTKNNDENMLLIKADMDVADIYLGEFFRLFNHFYFRYIANKLSSQEKQTKDTAFLKADDSWTTAFYKEGFIKEKRRKLFA